MHQRAAAFAATLVALLVGHTVGDHIVQTDHQAAHKAKATHGDTCTPSCPIDHRATSWLAMAGHVGGYTATCAAVLAAVHAATGVRPSWRRVLAGHAFSAASHAFIDRRWPVAWLLEVTGSAGFARSNRIPPLMVEQGAFYPWTVDAPLPIHGPYHADQALHHACLLVAALIITGGRRG